MEEKIREWADQQLSAHPPLQCPRCGAVTMLENAEENALSRRFDVYICSNCGLDEALEDAGISDPASEDQWFAFSGKVW